MRADIFAVTLMWASLTYADIKVSDVEVFSGYPWTEVVVGYAITGTDTDADCVRLTAEDRSANKTYTAQLLTGAALTEGRHILRWNAASEGVKFSSANVVFSVTIVDDLGVQLWENGPCWAEWNVGATKPEERGYYFWWGDTVGSMRNRGNDGWVSVVNGGSFSFESGNCPTYGKDNSQLQSAGYIDSTGNLVAKYDAATKYLGLRWRMPTEAEWRALFSNCTMTWTTLNGVTGCLVAGKGAYASKSIFLPATGHGMFSYFSLFTSFANYWSSTSISSDDSTISWEASLSNDDFQTKGEGRYIGHTVRPLRGFAQ